MTSDRRPSTRLRAVIGVIAGSLALGLVGLVAPTQALAADIGRVVIGPVTGTNTSVLKMTTSTACPAGSVYVTAYTTGPAGSNLSNMLSKSSDNLSNWTARAFTTSFDDAFSNLVGQTPGGVIVAGQYDVRLECLNLELTPIATMSGSFWFTTTTAMQNFGPSSAVTSVALAASPAGTAAPGAPVTLTATLTPAGAAGTVQFKDGTTNIGAPVAVSSGQAQVTTSSLSLGAHTLNADFTPADFGAFRQASATPVNYTVATVSTTTTLAVSPVGSAVVGDPVTLTATVSPTGAAGTVQFFDGASTLGSAQTVVSGKASVTTSALAQGVRSLTAAFTPTTPANFTASTSAPTSYTISPPGVPATVTGVVSANPATSTSVTSPVTFTITLTPSNAAGTVQFTDTPSGGSTVNLGAVQTVSGGTASVLTSALALGSHTIGATFTPSNVNSFTTATSSLPYSITTIPTTTTISTSPVGSANPGASVTLTAQVTPAAAAGTVQFFDGASPINSPVTVSGGSASTSTSALALGSHALKAVFTASGANYAGSTSADAAFSIVPVATTTTLTLSPAGVALPGADVTLTATVSPAAAPGTVQFTDGAAPLGAPVAVSGGQASFTTNALALGAHQLAAAFTSTSSSYANSASASSGYSISAVTPVVGTVVVNPAQGTDVTVMSLATSDPCPAGTVYVSATVNGPAGSNVTDMLSKSSDSLSNWTRAKFSTGLDNGFRNLVNQTAGAVLVVGKYDVTLTCSNANLDPIGTMGGSFWFTTTTSYQNSAPGTQSVNTAIVVTASPEGTSAQGQPVTLTATITPSDAVGTVQFKDSILNLFSNIGAPVAVVNGVATTTVTTLAPLPTTHLIFATFTPSNVANFQPSTAATIQYLVSKPPTATSVVPPSITGPKGVGGLLTCRRGTWTGAQSYSFQWMRNGSPLPGATSSTYRTTRYDGGASITCMVTASNAGGARSAVSSPLRVLTYLAPTKAIGVSGKAVVGRKFSAKLPTFTVSGASFSFQWFRGKKAIPKATKVSYKLTKADRGSKLRVRVVAKKAGYNTSVAYSRFSSKVR